MAPRVSIGLPVYNGECFLAQAIESVLAQTFSDFELIICDNASTDGTRDIAEAYAARDERVFYHRGLQNQGAARNFNGAFSLSHGEYFKWLAADDMIEPRYLEGCVAALDATPDAVLAYSRGRYVDADGGCVAECEHDVSLADQADVVRRFRLFREESAEVHKAWPMLYIFGLSRASTLRRTRPMGAYINSDACLVFELLMRGPFVLVPESLMLFRDHPGSYGVYANDSAKRQKFINPSAGRLMRLFGPRRLYLEYLLALAWAPVSLPTKVRVAYYHFKWGLGRKRIATAGASG